MGISAPNLALLRAPGRRSKLYLAIRKPNTIYTAVLAAVPTSTDMVSEVTYNTGSGTLANVKTGMTLYVGTSAGAHDVGMVRIRKDPDATNFYFCATSEIDWSAAATIYLTIVDDFQLRVKPPKVTGGALLMDTDVAYSDQHTVFDPMPVLGLHAVLWLTGATVNALFDASASWVFGSTISGYAWTAPGASASSGMTTATPTITYNAAGQYCVYCTVTAANGKTFMGVRYVFVYSAASMPVTAFALKENPRGDNESGGWNFGVTMFAEADKADVQEGALVILFSEDWYGGTKQSIGPVANRENIVAWGWIAGESIVWDPEAGSVDFSVQGAAAWMQKLASDPLDLKFSIATTTWNKIPQMTVDKALFHLLHWRTSVTQIMDVALTSDTRLLPEAATTGDSPWEQLTEIGKKIFARPGVDPYGRLFIEIDPQMGPEADRTWDTVMTITKQDWKDQIVWRKQKPSPASSLATSAINLLASGGHNMFYSLAMGHIQARHGKSDTLDMLLCSSQAQANTQAGLLLGWKINEWPDIPIVLAQNNRFITLWPRQKLAISMVAGDTPRGDAYSGNPVPRACELVWDPEAGCFSTSVICEAETFPTLVIDGDIPADPEDPDDPIDPPDDPDPPDPPDPPIGAPTDVLIAGYNSQTTDKHAGLYYTQNFDDDSPEWFEMNEGLTEAEYTNVQRIKLCPSGLIVILVGVTDSFSAVFCANMLGSVWTKLIDGTEIGGHITAIGVNPNTSEEIMVAGGENSPTRWIKLMKGSRGGLTELSPHIDNGRPRYWGDISYGMGSWILTSSRDNVFEAEHWWKISPTGAVISEGDLPNATNARHHWHIRGGGGIVYTWQNGNKTLDKSIDNGDTFVGLTAPPSDTTKACALACSPSGANLIAGGAGTSAEYSSPDYGESWEVLGNGLPVGFSVWDNCNTEEGFIGSGGQNIFYTPDLGASWQAKNGMLASVNGFLIITHMKYIAG